MKKKYIITFLPFFFILASYSQSISIDGKTYSIDTLSNYKVGPGTQYTAIRLKSSSRLDVFFLKSNVSNPYLSFKAVLGKDSIYTGEQPSSMAKRKSKEGAVYFAGTNGDFYDTAGYIGYSIGGCMVESEVAKLPSSDGHIIAFDENKIPTIGVMNYNGNIKFGNSNWAINTVNHLRGENQLVLFNQLNGKVTRTNAYGTEVLVQLVDGYSWGVNKIVKVKVIKVEKNVGSMAIPQGYAVLSGHGTAAINLNTLSINAEVEITLNMALNSQTSSYTNFIGGDTRNVMLKNGVVESDINEIWNELHPRTAIGYSQDKNTVIFCVVDGRGASAGVTTKQLAELMKSAGAYTAFNLDGGGSSCLYVKEYGPMNTPSDGVERAVSNGIFAVSSAPTDNTIAEIQSYDKKIYLPHYGLIKPKFIGYNQYGVLLNKDLQNVTLSCAPEVGEIDANGRFVASGTNGGIITATYNGITTNLQIVLVNSAEIAFKLDSVLINDKRNYPVQVQSVIGLNTMDVLPAALTWNVLDPTLCSISNGVLKGIKNGTTQVIGTLGDFKDTILVKVEIPIDAKMIADDFSVNGWTLNATSALNAVLNTQNLPSNWTSGATVNFVYTAARAPFVKLSKDIPLYSLPDSIKVNFNVGNMAVSKLLLSMRANNSTLPVSTEFKSISLNTDTQISIATNALFDTTDISIYPVWFSYLNFYLGALTANQAYTIALKDITLCYAGFDLSATPSVFMSKFKIYPNPLTNKDLTIKIQTQDQLVYSVQLMNLSGQLVRSPQICNNQSDAHLSINGLKAGIYLLNISGGSISESTRLIIK